MNKTVLAVSCIFIAILVAGCKGKETAPAYNPGPPNELLKPPVAHAKYLGEPSTFVDVDLPLPSGERVAVIGSDEAWLYSKADIKTDEDAAGLEKLEEIPLGTLLAIGKKVESDNQDRSGLFSFEGYHNWFYPVTWNGMEGLVFGADLCEETSSPEKSRVVALRYRTAGRYDRFYPLYGLDPLPVETQEVLSRDRVAFQETNWKEKEDEMYGLYEQETGNNQNCIFVTTDLAAHTLHLQFDRYLQSVEEKYFAPRLLKLIGGFIAEIDARIASDDKSIPKYTQTLEMARFYLLVPRAILEASPLLSVDENGKASYGEQDRNAVLARYPEEVRKTIAFIDAHSGSATVPIIMYKEDFSQYKPRGHYTRNGILSSYFQAMMWFGRIHAYIGMRATQQDEVWGGDGAITDTTKLSLHLTPMAVVLNDIAAKNEGLYRDWKALFDPITRLIGISDDLSFDDSMPYIDRQHIPDLKPWCADENAIKAFVQKANMELEPPRIAGNSMLHTPTADGNKPPMGWRLFGQRFTWDSAVHQAVSSPRLDGRDIVSGVDVIKVFGSSEADRLLTSWEYGYQAFDNLKPTLDNFEADFSARKADFWGETYYNRNLFLIKSQADFERGAGYYFTESPAWASKAMLSANGTWAELRHDTILYVKQVYGEGIGGGEGDASWRTKPIPEPINYIEPNLPFWTGAKLAIRDLRTIAGDAGLLPVNYPGIFESFEEILSRAVEIVELEAEDKPISEEQNEFIRAIPHRLKGLSEIVNGLFEPAYDDKRMGLIADVFSSTDLNKVLEVAVGKPYRMQVLLNDGQGGKRVATGYVFGYYEFMHPMDDRMTDEQWKEIAYEDGADLKKYQPFWMKDVKVLPAVKSK